MHDKTIRRRRAVLALLVLCSFGLLTASFGGSAGGGIGAVQRGIFEVVAPVQDGASQTLKPARDLFGWFGDTLDAKGENEDLRKERDALRREAVDADVLRRQNAALRAQLRLDERLGLDRMGPVSARVIVRSNSVLNQTVNINKGSSDGIRVDQPVVTSSGLVGKISFVSSGTSKVTLITDADFGASARISDSGVTGGVVPAAGAPRELRLMFTTSDDVVQKGNTVVTDGTTDDPQLRPLFPPDIPIGRVTRVDDPGTDAQEVHIRPFVDIRDVSYVQVLTDLSGADTA